VNSTISNSVLHYFYPRKEDIISNNLLLSEPWAGEVPRILHKIKQGEHMERRRLTITPLHSSVK
jgi:hypothetical protein